MKRVDDDRVVVLPTIREPSAQSCALIDVRVAAVTAGFDSALVSMS
jgi:hypothetical protein